MQKIDTLEKVPFDQLAAAFTAAFADYFFPITFTKEQLENKFLNEGGRLDLSVGVFDNSNLIAFILHFIDHAEGEVVIYNGGTGVLPTYRGNQLTSKMYAYILPKLKENNVEKMCLEVLTQNTPALKTYQRQGFRIVRELLCFKGTFQFNAVKPVDEQFKIVELNELNWNLLQTFWDVTPTWQNSISTMQHLQMQNRCFGIYKKDTLLGYIIYNPVIKRIHQLAVDKRYRGIGLGSHLLQAIVELEKEAISMINIDAGCDALIHLLKRSGLENYTNQYEMERGM